MSNFANILKELRIHRGMSQSDLARLLGVARSTVSSYENGSRSPDKDTLIRIANCMQVTIDYLLGNDNFNKDYSNIYSSIFNDISDLLTSAPIALDKKKEILNEVSDYFRWKLQQAELNHPSGEE